MFRKILFWFGGMLLFSFAAYLATSFWLSSRRPMREPGMRRHMSFEFSESVRAYEAGGPAAVGELLSRLDRLYPGVRHFLADGNGRDLVTGEDRSALLRQQAPPRPFPFFPPGEFTAHLGSDDEKYLFVVHGRPVAAETAWSNMAVYGWIVLVIVLLCYTLAWTLATPIRKLRQTVIRFGQGDLTSRTQSQRKDELGDLARAFDEMADRIQTLLAAERRLLQDVSHELRSPLTRLRFALELARSSPDPKTALDRVNKEVERLSTLVGELLQVTRAEGDPASREVTAIDFAPFLETLVEDARIEAEASGCILKLSINEGAVCQGDRELLHRAVDNVLRNAIRHAPSGTAVEIDLQSETGQIILRVRDYGPGLPEDQLEQVFRPFHRLQEDRSRDDGGGIGLGLAIARRAIRLHQGKIHASNAGPGLLVEIRLPR